MSGSIATESGLSALVRFTPDSDRTADIAGGPSCHKRKSIGADVDLYALPVDGRRTRAISQSGIAHNATCRINRRSA